MNHIPLDSQHCTWTLHAVGHLANVPADLRERLVTGVGASVPGCVHTDLMTARLMDDPYIADNELRQYWIGRTDWRYACQFQLDAAMLEHQRLDLACDGLDTLATVVLNDIEVGRSSNMHAACRFDVRPAARAGTNNLSITFSAPMPAAEREQRRYPGLPCRGGASGKVNPHNMLRKMSCNMGWDWGPEVTTAGIWRPIRVEAWDVAHIKAVRPLVRDASETRAAVEVHVDVEFAASPCDVIVDAKLVGPHGRTVGQVSHDKPIQIAVSNPLRWWPVGHGDQPLYALTVTLRDSTGKQLDHRRRRIGLRTTALDLTPDPTTVSDPIPDARGEAMTLLVNGKPIYCKGANWIPDDCFPHRVTPERYRQRITQARDANMNMLRVWGGGIYEDEAFYNVCDELGVMVWQDFLFACACYPEEEPYRSLVEAEARDNIARLSSHPSLVIYNGCNENVWGTFDWGDDWRAVREEGQQTWGLGYYLDLLPRLLREVDPSRPYWPASPYSGSMDRHPNANEYGNVHIWEVWHGAGQYRNYLAYWPRMTTEFGYHGPACYATVARSIPDPKDRWWNSPLMQLHNKNGRPGQLQTNTRMADDFEPPTDDYDAWHFLAQVMQARALSMGVEWFRALHPWNSGALFWQLNDCWPVSSWSAIDGDGREKPLYFAARRFFAPRVVTIKPRRVVRAGDAIGPLSVCLHNDSDARWDATCVLRQMSLDGQIVREHRELVNVAPRSLVKFDVPHAMRDRGDAFLVADAGDEARGFWWFAPDKELRYPPPRFEAALTRHDNVYRLTVTAKTLMRDLCVFPDRLDPDSTISDGFVTLLPGESHTFVIASRNQLTAEQLTAPPVMNCVNRYGAS